MEGGLAGGKGRGVTGGDHDSTLIGVPSEIFGEIFEVCSTRHIGLKGATYGFLLLEHCLRLYEPLEELREALEAFHGVGCLGMCSPSR